MIVIQYQQESMMTTTQPVALVTGATSGIGKAAALALADAGFEVIGTGRNTARITPRGGVTYLDLDVSSDESVAAVVQQVIERLGRLDVLVNNAGIGSAGAAEENSVVQAQGVFDVNVFGLIRMTRAVLPHMRAQGSGRIINISSVLGSLPAPYGALYAASKHAVEGYSESVDHEVREHGYPGAARRARLHQHRVRGERRAARHPSAGLRAAAAHRRPGSGGGSQGRRRSRHGRQGDRRGSD
jgi:NAD(P)-dependent dehydrogenase (short-subunit alcohol dehydrogenase family)